MATQSTTPDPQAQTGLPNYMSDQDFEKRCRNDETPVVAFLQRETIQEDQDFYITDVVTFMYILLCPVWSLSRCLVTARSL